MNKSCGIPNIAEAQRETVIEPHGVADDFGWKTEAWVAKG